MLISRHPLTGATVIARRSSTPGKDVAIDAQAPGAAAMVFLTATEALAVAAYALGAPQEAIEVAITQLGPDHVRPELVRLITDNKQEAGQ